MFKMTVKMFIIYRKAIFIGVTMAVTSVLVSSVSIPRWMFPTIVVITANFTSQSITNNVDPSAEEPNAIVYDPTQIIDANICHFM